MFYKNSNETIDYPYVITIVKHICLTYSQNIIHKFNIRTWLKPIIRKHR